MFYAPWPENYLTRSQSGSNKMSHIGPSLSTIFIATYIFKLGYATCFHPLKGKSHNKHVRGTDTLVTHLSKILWILFNFYYYSEIYTVAKKTSGPVFEDSHLFGHFTPPSKLYEEHMWVISQCWNSLYWLSVPPSSAAALTCSQLSKLLHLVNEASGTSKMC